MTIDEALTWMAENASEFTIAYEDDGGRTRYKLTAQGITVKGSQHSITVDPPSLELVMLVERMKHELAKTKS